MEGFQCYLQKYKLAQPCRCLSQQLAQCLIQTPCMNMPNFIMISSSQFKILATEIEKQIFQNIQNFFKKNYKWKNKSLIASQTMYYPLFITLYTIYTEGVHFRKALSSQINLIKCENAIRAILKNAVEQFRSTVRKWDTPTVLVCLSSLRDL